MLLCWNVRCLDTRGKESKDRILWLDTNNLLPETKAEVELCLSTSGSSVNPKMLKYRHFFKEEHVTSADLEKSLRAGGGTGASALKATSKMTLEIHSQSGEKHGSQRHGFTKTRNSWCGSRTPSHRSCWPDCRSHSKSSILR